MPVNVLHMFSDDGRPSVPDFAALAGAGIFGVIQRASQGIAYIDPTYHQRRVAAQNAGLLWGAMHTIDAGDATIQASFFLAAAGYYDADVDITNTLLAVEWVDLTDTAALHQLYQFCAVVNRLSFAGVEIVVRGGDLLRRNLTAPNGGFRSPAMIGASDFFALLRLWTNETVYETVPPPKPMYPWDNYWLREVKPMVVKHPIGNSGTNIFAGDKAALSAAWLA